MCKLCYFSLFQLQSHKQSVIIQIQILVQRLKPVVVITNKLISIFTVNIKHKKSLNSKHQHNTKF